MASGNPDFNPFTSDLPTPEILESSNAKKLKLSENREGRVFGVGLNTNAKRTTGTDLIAPTRRLLASATGLASAPRDKDFLVDDDILFGSQTPDPSPEPTKKVVRVPTKPIKLEQPLKVTVNGGGGYGNGSAKGLVPLAVSPIPMFAGHGIGTGTGTNLNRVPKRTVSDLDKSLDELIYEKSSPSEELTGVGRPRHGTFSRFVTDIDGQFSDESEELENSNSGSGSYEYGQRAHFARSAGITPQHQTHQVPTTGILPLQQQQLRSITPQHQTHYIVPTTGIIPLQQPSLDDIIFNAVQNALGGLRCVPVGPGPTPNTLPTRVPVCPIALPTGPQNQVLVPALPHRVPVSPIALPTPPQTQIRTPTPVAALANASPNGAVGMTGAPYGTIPKQILHYWHQRYDLFIKYDEGIQLDKESWYSVTPECIAHHQAVRAYECLGKDKSNDERDKLVILDAFAGCGGNSIQFAQYFKNVISVDIDPAKTAMAKNNAKVYGVEKNIKFITANIYQLLPMLSSSGAIDGIFLSPPWGGPSYNARSRFLLHDMNGWILFDVCKNISPNIIFYCPRNINRSDLVKCAERGGNGKVEIEDNIFLGRPKAVTAYYGKFVRGEPIKT